MQYFERFSQSYIDHYLCGGDILSIKEPPPRPREVSLYWAILAQAIVDLARDDLDKFKYRKDKRREIERNKYLASKWFVESDDEAVSFEVCCEAVDVEPSRVLAALTKGGLLPSSEAC